MARRTARNNTAAALEILAAELPNAEMPAEVVQAEFEAPVLALPAPHMVEGAPATRVRKIAPIAQRPERNGVRRPSPEGLCGAVWAHLDALYAEGANPVPMPKAVAAWALGLGYNATNATIELYQWRKFNGISGRQGKAAQATTDAAPATVAVPEGMVA